MLITSVHPTCPNVKILIKITYIQARKQNSTKSLVITMVLSLNSTFQVSFRCLPDEIPYFVQNSISFCTSSKAAYLIYFIPTCSFRSLKQKRRFSIQTMTLATLSRLTTCLPLLTLTTYQPIKTYLPSKPISPPLCDTSVHL